MDDILKYDSSFTESKFKSFVDNVFIQVHLAVMMREPEKIRHFVSEDLYHDIVQRVENLKQKNVIQMYDEINVKQTTILQTEIKKDFMEIEVHITSRYMDYLMDEDGNFISGVNTERIQKENTLIFRKRIDFLKQESVRKCPGCGVSIDVNANGLCSYCGTTYNLEDKDWVLVSLKTM